MIKNLTRLHRFFQFSTASTNPYFILGLDSQASFAEVKKNYYKLAAQYHPDINKSSNATKQFMLIKEAFERIKSQRGEGVAMDVEGVRQSQSDFQSVRKNHKDYEEPKEDGAKEDFDYKEFVHKAEDESNEEYGNLKQSFKTMSDLKDETFKPIDMEMPSPDKRFHLDQVVRLKVFSDQSFMYLVMLAFGMFGLIFLVYFLQFYFHSNTSFSKVQQKRFENYIYTLLNYQTIKEDLDDQTFIETLNYSLKDNAEYKEVVKKETTKKNQDAILRKAGVPVLQEFISTKQVKSEAQL